jgi:hypothetical protein
MVVAGVIGYPAKKRQPAATAPRAIASLPSNRLNGIVSSFILLSKAYFYEPNLK